MDPLATGEATALALGIAGGALISEDGATVTAAALAASRVLDANLAFFSAFLGLWVGDLGIYALARSAGPPILKHRWFSRWLGEPRQTSQNTVGWSLALSRFFPGTRLPMYVSAGFHRMPVATFGIITAASALLWTFLVFQLIHLAPAHAATVREDLVWAGVIGIALFGLLTAWRKCGVQVRKWLRRALERVVRWEFWPAWLFYSPVALFCVWLGMRYRGFSLPAVANLNQKNGGIIGESKIKILCELMDTAPGLTAEAHLIGAGPLAIRLATVREVCARHAITVPFVVKPDIAQRGAGFKKISSMDQVEGYLSQVSPPVLLQRYVAGPKEAGIFYYKFPGEVRGHIFGITRKEFPTVTGDGWHTIRQLINRDGRARLMARTYLRRLKEEADRIPLQGERVRLVEAGNHCQGCEFRDGADLYTEELRAAFDRISQNVHGFHVGRFDVRYESDEELRKGRGFQIIELNGAASEATNIYDGRNSLWSAYSTLYRQWKIVYKIGAANRRRGFRPPSAFSVWCDWKRFAGQACEFPLAD